MKKHWTNEDIVGALTGTPTRRQFLQGGAALAAGAYLAPCFANSAQAAGLGELKLLAWEGFSFQQELADFLKEKGIALTVSTISTQDDVQVRLSGATPTAIDVTSYNQGYAELYGKALKIMQPLDLERLPNYNEADIFPEFYHQPAWFWDGDLYGVVMGWGVNTIVYNPDLVPEPKSYKDLLQPEYTGKIAFIDDSLANWPIFARIAGFGDKYPNLTTDELATVFEAMQPYRDQSKVFASSIGDVVNLFSNGEIGVLFCGWSGTPSETIKQNVTTKYTIPAEGGAIWSDAFFIPKSAQNLDAAYAYINEILSPEAQAEHARLTLSGTINRKAVPLMDEATRQLFDYDNLKDIFDKSPLPAIPPLQSEDYATFEQWVTATADFKIGF